MTDIDRVDKKAPEEVKTSWAVTWAIWVGLGLLIEFYALAKKGKGDTLSEQVWAVQDRLSKQGLWGKIARWGLVAGIVTFLVWLIPHWALGII